MRLAATAAILSFLVTAYHATAFAAGSVLATAPGIATERSTLFGEDDLLLFELTAGGEELADSFPAYSSRAGLFFPLGALARVLGLAIVEDPPAEKAEGWLLSENRRFLLDLRTHRANVGDKSYDAPATQAVLFNHQIYVRSDLLQQLLPISLTVDKSDLSIRLTTREPFPFQQRLDREKRRKTIGVAGGVEERTVRIPSSYALFTPPSADLTLDGGWSNQSPRTAFSYNLRLGGDLAYAGLQLFVGSDNAGRPTTVNALLERKDPDGLTAGLFGATRSDAGDVYTPALSIGPASIGGRGVMMTSLPLDQASAFSTTDVRGPLPAGYEVELYLNEVLRGSTAQAVLGNYEFLSVPLTYGLNLIRLVFYGPHGEHYEEIRRVNVGTSQLAKGQAVYSFAAIQQNTPVVQLSGALPSVAGVGRMRAVGSLSYGLTDAITLIGSVAQYTPNSSFDYGQRQMAAVGISSSIWGFATELNAAADNRRGLGLAAGMGGRILDISLLARHAEYSGNFIDEQQNLDLSSPSPLRRASQITLSWSPTIPLIELTLPLSAHAEQSQYIDGSSRLLGDWNISTTVDRFNVSAGWQYQQTKFPSGPSTVSSIGTVAASVLAWQLWQLRADATFSAAPKWQIDTAELVVDGRISEDVSVRLNAEHAFAQTTDIGTGTITAAGTTTLTGGLTWRLPRFDISLNASFTPETSQTQIGVQLNLGALFDPLRGDYRAVRTGAAAGGNAALDAFVDRNADGIHQANEPGVPGIIAQGGNYPATSDDTGDLLLSALGDGAHARIRVDPQSIPDPYLATPADVIEIVPHAGQVTVVPYPLRSLGEVAVRALFSAGGAEPQGLSALRLQLVSQSGAVAAEARSEYDGAVLFERIPPGEYVLRIDPEQSRELKLVLFAPVHLTVPTGGGYVRGATAIVTRQ